MKSKNPKIQILKKELVIFLALMLITAPILLATQISSNDISKSNSSFLNVNLNELIYGKIGLAVNDIKEKLEAGESIIEINDEIQLRALAEIVNDEKNGLEGITILITDDITINSDEEWIPIGTEETPFQGNFVGGELDEENKIDTSIERYIDNLQFTKDGKEYDELINIGLFGVIGETGLVQNIITYDFNIDILYDSVEEYINTYYYNAGNIAGMNKGTIKDCVNYSDIKGGTCVGGIVGYNEGKISNCMNAGIIMGNDNTDGIAGQNIGKIENCIDDSNSENGEFGISVLGLGEGAYIERDEDIIDITELFPKTNDGKDAEKTTVKFEIKKGNKEITDKTYLTYHGYARWRYIKHNINI